jgi:phage shock protein PspC (stress-responsive transcriptional regulator)
MSEQQQEQPIQAQDQPQPQPAYQPAYQPKRLVRRSDDRMIAGVCSGIADYLGVDVTLVRVLAVVGTIFGFGSLLVAYIILWAVVPEV